MTISGFWRPGGEHKSQTGRDIAHLRLREAIKNVFRAHDYRPSRVCLGRLIERAIGADSLDTEPNSLGSSDLRSHVGSVRCAQFEYTAANGEVQPTADDEPRSQEM